MSTIRTADDAKRATGWDRHQWQFFHTVTSTVLEAILGLELSTPSICTSETKERVRQLAEKMKAKHGQISSWKDTTPSESAAALRIVSDQLILEEVPIPESKFPDVFRWRMMEAFRYYRRRYKPDEAQSTTLPGVNEMLQRGDAEGASA